MTNPFVGEIRAFPYNFVPRDWLPCDGRLLPIRQYTALFSLLGTSFDGGDGKTTFALPDLVDKAAMGTGMAMGLNNSLLGEEFGSSTVSLTPLEMPAHSHTLQRKGHGTGSKTSAPSSDAFVGQIVISDSSGKQVRQAESFVTNATPDTNLEPGVIGISGQSQPHENRQPYLKLVYCIAVAGIFPTR